MQILTHLCGVGGTHMVPGGKAACSNKREPTQGDSVDFYSVCLITMFSIASTYMCVYIYMYIHKYREREPDKKDFIQ